MARFNNGWIKVYRSMGDGDLAENPILLALWIRLLTWATWKSSKVLWNGEQREIPAGSVVFGFRELAAQWGCSAKTIHKWAHYLHSTKRIALETSTHGSLATICNWEIYQAQEDAGVTPREREVNAEGTPGKREVNLIEESKKEERRKKRGESAVALPRLAEIWNQHRGSLPEVKGCNGSRRKHAEARWREEPDAERWAAVVQRLARSPFCTGDNDRGWRADFDFLIRPETKHKADEGKYDERGGRTSINTRPLSMDELEEERELIGLRNQAIRGSA